MRDDLNLYETPYFERLFGLKFIPYIKYIHILPLQEAPIFFLPCVVFILVMSGLKLFNPYSLGLIVFKILYAVY